MSEVSNIDGILVPREQAMVKNEQIPAQPANQALEQSQEPKVDNSSDKVDKPNSGNAAPVVEVSESAPEVGETLQVEAEKPQVSDDKPIDEYGNPIEKPRLYTEEELQQRIRDRLSRGRHAEQPAPQQIQQAAKDFTPDPNSEDDWQTQLADFVDKTIDRREQKRTQEQWQAKEHQRQADFESKFNAGMSKYQDFHKVVEGKPITNEIMLAARSLDNPAAFIYGASKLHPQELDRIARIDDPYVQAAEVGRLHERMVKARNVVSKASKPLDVPRGDVPQKTYTRPSLENLIDQHAKQKRIR